MARAVKYGAMGANSPEAGQRQIALISNEPTPYRLHVLNRLASELPDVRIHNIFTHTISNPTMPWQMSIPANLNPVFFEQHHLIPGKPFSIRAWLLYRDIRNYLRENKVCMVILLGYNDLTRLQLFRWGLHDDVPVLLTADSNIFADARTNWRVRLLKRPLVRWVLRHIAGLMPMGTCGRAFFRSYLDHNLPEFLFPYEPDYESLNKCSDAEIQAFCAKMELLPDRRRLLFCGRLVGVKCVDVLLQAFERIAVARPQWDLIIAGDGPLREQLQQKVPPHLSDRVKWLGFLQFDQTALLYHSCDVLVHPSEYEPWALVINEAVACGLAVVATSVVGAAVELVRHRDNGLIVPPRSIEAMTDALWEITEEDRHLEMRRRSAAVLDSWRQAADPVEGVRQALRHFGISFRQPLSPAPSNSTPDASADASAP